MTHDLLTTQTFDVSPTGVSEQAARFSYDAIVDKKRRKPPSGVTQSEDKLLDQSGRRKLQSGTRDIRRNFAIAAWAIRKHLDFVSQFEFHSRTDDEGFNRDLEFLVRKVWARPTNCDAAGRHTFPKLIRLAEACRTVDGDVGMLKLASAQLQGIEGDRLRNPSGRPSFERNDGTRWVHGVKINRAGRALAYGLHNRVNGGSAFRFDRTIRGSRLCMHGYYDRFDQIRGVSPIAAAINPLRDVYEGFDYALAKAKVSQIFALAIYSQMEETQGEITTGEDVDADGEDDRYSVDVGRGPIKMELDPGDRAEFLESNHPSSEFQAFSEMVIGVALKAIGIPFNFYRENFTNFFGGRSSWLLYDRSCRDKRADVMELLRRLSVWRIMLWILDGTLTLPRGETLATLKFEWVPIGMPWWDPAKEIRGDLMAIGAGLDNPQRIVKERGRGDWYDNVDQIAKAMKYASKHPDGPVPLSFDPGQPEPVEVVGNDK